MAIKRRQDSAEQIVATLRQAELGMPVSEQVRQLGISAQTFYCWKKHYAGLESNQARQLKQLEDGNARPKKLVVGHHVRAHSGTGGLMRAHTARRLAPPRRNGHHARP